MKKYILLFGAGGMLALASCGGGENKPEDSQQAIDSAVNANMQVKEAQMKAYNDSVINAAAIEKAKADSILKAAEQTKASGGKSTGKSTKPTKTTQPTPPPPPAEPAKPTVDPQKQRNNRPEGTTTPTQSEDPQKRRNNQR